MSAHEDAVEVIAHTIWTMTGAEGECPKDDAYWACEDCMRVIFRPAAEAVLALPEVALSDSSIEEADRG